MAAAAAQELPSEWSSFRQHLKHLVTNKAPQLDDDGRIRAATLASVMPASQALQVTMIRDLIMSTDIPHLATEASFPVLCVIAEALMSIGIDMNVVFGVLLSFALKQATLCTHPLRELAPNLEWWDSDHTVAQDEHMATVNIADLSKLKHRENAWALLASLAARGYANAHTIIKAAMNYPEPFLGFVVYAFTHYAFALKTLPRRAIGDGHAHSEEATVDGHGFFLNEIIAHRSFIQQMLRFDYRAGLQSKLLTPVDPMAIKLPKSDNFLIHDFHLMLCLEKWFAKHDAQFPCKIVAMHIIDEWILRTPQRDKQVFQLYLYMEDRRLHEEVLRSVIDVNAG